MYLQSLLLVLLLRFGSIIGQPQPCFLKCKDNYMHGMQTELADASSEWSVDMVTPLQTILTGDNKKGRLSTKMDSVCKYNAVFNRCLHSCPDNPAKRILRSGQKAWNIICDDFRNDTEFRSIVVPCWADNGRDIARRCTTQAGFLQAEIVQMMESGVENIQEGINNLCRSVHAYDKCFVHENYEYCGINAGKFLVKLTHQTSHELIEMLDDVLGVHELPKTCKEWLNQRDMTGLSRARAVHRRLRNSSDGPIHCFIWILFLSFVFYLY